MTASILLSVCNPAAGSLLEKMIDIPCHYSAFTAPEAARELGLTIGPQDDPQYADSLHAAWIGQKTRFALPMQAAELSKVHQLRRIAAAAMFLLFSRRRIPGLADHIAGQYDQPDE